MSESQVPATRPVFDTEALGAITSFEDAIALLQSSGVSIGNVEDYGDGFHVVDKASLLNRPFVIVDSKLTDGDYGQFAVVTIVTQAGEKGIITDGSTGIKDQIVRLHNRQVYGGLMVPNGLDASDYTYEDDKGETKPARTYYISGM